MPNLWYPLGFSMSQPLPKLDRAYLLLTFIPYYVAADGSVWLERLWHHDFVAHLEYLPKLTLAAPRLAKGDQADLIRLEIPEGVDVRFAPLPPAESTKAALRNLPSTIACLWSAIGNAEIVHSGVAGWPFPLGWLANPIALFRKKKLVIVVESAPWRLTAASRNLFKDRLRAEVTESLAKWSVNRANLNLFTHPGYRESLFTNGRGASYVTPATWINEQDILSLEKASALWEQKQKQAARFLFAGRLSREKGIDVLLQALRALDTAKHSLSVDIIGDGPRLEACRASAAELKHVQLKVLEPVPYGPAFFELLHGYRAILVPSLGDEQPRIVFDAYSQALPVVAADTPGLVPHVEDRVTGFHVRTGDPEALATKLLELRCAAAVCERAGLRALEVARTATHRAMHENRCRILIENFGSSPQSRAIS